MRWLWLLFGAFTQICFAGLVVSLMWFMQFGSTINTSVMTPIISALAINILLIVGFALPHSVLLVPFIRRTISRFMPSQLYGCLFCLISCLTLWTIMFWWQPLPGVLWQLADIGWWTMIGAAAGAWILLAYSMWLTGLGYQTGFTGLKAFWRPTSVQPRSFAPRGLYRYFRHPIYISFLLIAWLTPVMTTDHLLLSVGLTLYLFIGSWLKDRRLAKLIGEPYKQYMAAVPGYPGLHWGPLGIVPKKSAPI